MVRGTYGWGFWVFYVLATDSHLSTSFIIIIIIIIIGIMEWEN
jgi:hypothetical protein